jgi:photosystem II stability/assembly factor-like uncharacterized protein
MRPLHAWIVAFFIIGCGGSPSPSPAPPSSPSGGGGGGGGGSGGGTGGGGSWLTTKSGAVWSSGDGEQFSLRGRPTDAALLALVCVNHLDGWAAGSAGTIIGTHDGGATWAVEPTGVRTTLRAIAFADTRNGMAVGDAGTILRTVDGGDHWTPVVVTDADLWSVALSTVDGQAWVVGAGGVMLHSSDRGVSFDPPRTVASAGLRAIRFAGEAGIGVAAGDGGILLVSRDGGARWQELAAHAPADLHGLSLSDDGQRVMAVGAAGLIWRSSDAGASWQRVDTGDARALAAIGFSDEVAGRGWAVGEHGALLVTNDYGASFAALPSPADVDFTSVEDL